MDDGNLQYAQAVYDASTEVDARYFLEIAGRAGDLRDLVAQVDDLRKHLVVKDKILAVDLVVDASQDLAGESPVTGMVFGQFLPEHNILEKGEGAVEDIFVQGHAAVKRSFAQGTGTEHALVYVVGDKPGHRRDEFRGILIIRM